MQVKDLIEILKAYKPDEQILIRQSHGDGYYSDRDILVGRLFPEHEPRIMAGEIAGMSSEKNREGRT